MKYYVRDLCSPYSGGNSAVFDSPIPVRIGESVIDYDGYIWKVKDVQYKASLHDELSAYLICNRVN